MTADNENEDVLVLLAAAASHEPHLHVPYLLYVWGAFSIYLWSRKGFLFTDALSAQMLKLCEKRKRENRGNSPYEILCFGWNLINRIEPCGNQMIHS